MRTFRFYLFGCVAVLYSPSLVRHVRGDCLAGDIPLRPGDTIGPEGYECVNDSAFAAKTSVCDEDGTLRVIADDTITCSSILPYCVQCDGKASCSSNPDPLPSRCRSQQATSNPRHCLVGDIMYSAGDNVGHLGVECINGSEYTARLSTCGGDGTIVASQGTLTCPAVSPHCVQCDAPGPGAALCLSTPELPSHCDPPSTDSTTSQSSTTTSQSACRVGDILYPPGEDIGHIGIECLDGTTYRAELTTCGNDGALVTSEVTATCPSTSPNCVQCGSTPSRGAALCLFTPEVPDHCEPTTTTTTDSKPSGASLEMRTKITDMSSSNASLEMSSNANLEMSTTTLTDMSSSEASLKMSATTPDMSSEASHKMKGLRTIAIVLVLTFSLIVYLVD